VVVVGIAPFPCRLGWDSMSINKYHHLQFGIYSLGAKSFFSHLEERIRTPCSCMCETERETDYLDTLTEGSSGCSRNSNISCHVLGGPTYPAPPASKWSRSGWNKGGLTHSVVPDT